MAMNIVQQLPPIEEVEAELPVTSAHRIPENRDAVQRILTREDKRMLAVVGPCSAYPVEAVERYAEKLARLEEEIRGQVLIVMRCYTQKPRTTTGWTGIMQEPDPLSGKKDLAKGIWTARRLMSNVAKILPIADEMLYAENGPYAVPLLSYVAVGARSAEDQEHRQLASGIDVPVGMKNPTSGDIATGVNSVVAAQAVHEFPYRGAHVRTSGNPYAHLILRGGADGPNYDPHSIAVADKLLKEQAAKNLVQNPAILIDASHDNAMNGSGKDPELQGDVVHAVLRNVIRQRPEYAKIVGFMIEGYELSGKQGIKPGMDMGGLSITDGCLGWDETEKLLKEMADQLSKR
jgi:3-deoxy-7-phosphoheptulonate synthase